MPVANALPNPGIRLRIRFALTQESVLAVGAIILLSGAVLWTAVGPNVEKTDFSVTYIGAYLVHHGRGAELYDLDSQARLRSQLFTRAERLFFEHPPFEALLLSPLAALPYRTAYVVWGFLNVLVWLALPWLVRPYAPLPKDSLAYGALWLAFAPLGIALYQGQSSLLLSLLYLATFRALKQGRDYRAGLYLGLGLFKFQFVLPFVCIFALRRKWTFVRGFLSSMAAFGLLSLVAVGWQGCIAYLRLLLRVAGSPANKSYGAASDMATIQGLVHATLGRFSPGWMVTLLVVMASLSLVGCIAWKWRKCSPQPSSPSSDMLFAASLGVALLTGFHMFTHDLSPLMLPLMLVMARLPGQSQALRLMGGASLVLLFTPPLYLVLISRHCLYLLVPILLTFTFISLKMADREEGTWIAS